MKGPSTITIASRSLRRSTRRASSKAVIMGYASAPPPAIATINFVPA